MKTNVLVLHPDPEALRRATQLLEAQGYAVEGASSLLPNPGPLATAGPDAILLGGPLDGEGADGTWRRIRALFPEAALLVLAPAERSETTLARLGSQVDDLLPEPLEPGRLSISLRNALARRRLERRVAALVSELERGAGFDFLVARSDAMRRTVELLRKAAEDDAPLLITGRPGSEQELAARAVHGESSRAAAAFVGLDLGALPEERLVVELFGPGSGRTSGALERAKGGTLYLAQIERLPRGAQEILLRALETPRAPRLIAASQRSSEALDAMLTAPLRARLGGRSVHLPALAERVGDVPALAWSSVRRLGLRHGRRLEGLTSAAVAALEAHPWPGDVRELEAVLERALLVAEGPRLDVADLPGELSGAAAPRSDAGGRGSGSPSLPGDRPPADPEAPSHPNGTSVAFLPQGTVLPFHELERRILLHALRTTGWNVQEAARRLKLGRATIYRKIDRYGLKREAG